MSCASGRGNTGRIRRVALKAFLLLSILVAVAPLVGAAPADLDNSFGSGGKVVTSMAGYDSARAVAVQPDGKLVLVGSTTGCSDDPGCEYADRTDFAIARYHPDGQLDASFSDDGRVITAISLYSTDVATSVAIAPDGKIVVAGGKSWSAEGPESPEDRAPRMVVARYLPDGRLDPSFFHKAQPGSMTAANAAAVLADGRVVVGGFSGRDFAVARLLDDGRPDPTFGVDGYVVHDFGANDSVTEMALLPDGRIVAAGTTAAPPAEGAGAEYPPSDFAVARFNPDGSLDRGFGDGGAVTTAVGPDSAADRVAGMAVQRDGRIVVAGTSGRRRDEVFALARYLPDGRLDPDFDGDGIVTMSVTPHSDTITGVALQRDGKILVAGRALVYETGFYGDQIASTTMVVARYLVDGSLDPNFGEGGPVTMAADADDVGIAPSAALVQRDGRIVVAGTQTVQTSTEPNPPATATHQYFAIMRFLGDPPTPLSGYWMVGATGAVYAFGDALHYGNAPAAVDVESTPDGDGYWTVDAAGVVSAFGYAGHFGNIAPGQLAPGESVTSLSATPTGAGYWLFTTKGRVIANGDATFLGDMAATTLNGPVQDSIPTPSGRGYYMVASDGGIFSFGDATFRGSMGDTRLNAPVGSLAPDRDGVGYWLVASDGGVFAFDAHFRGSMGGTKLNKPIVGMVRNGIGYLMVGADGGIFNFSEQPFHGSLGDKPPDHPIVAVASLSQ